MAIPDYQTCMLHVPRVPSDGAEHSLKDAVPVLADTFHLTDAERTELLLGGQRAAFHNRVAWANTYLKKAGLLSAPRHGVFTITDRGKSVLAKNPPRIDRSFLEQFPEFLAFSGKSKTGSEADLVQLKPPAGIETPLESLEIAHEKIRKELKIELLDPRSLQIFVLIYLLIKPERGVRSSAKQLSG